MSDVCATCGDPVDAVIRWKVGDKVFCSPDCLLPEVQERMTPDPLLIQPKNTMPEINTIWAVLSVDPEDGNEGVCAASMGKLMMPLIAADETRLELIVQMGIDIAKRTDRELRLVKFDSREDLGLLWSDNDRELAKIAKEVSERFGFDTTRQ